VNLIKVENLGFGHCVIYGTINTVMIVLRRWSRAGMADTRSQIVSTCTDFNLLQHSYKINYLSFF